MKKPLKLTYMRHLFIFTAFLFCCACAPQIHDSGNKVVVLKGKPGYFHTFPEIPLMEGFQEEITVNRITGQPDLNLDPPGVKSAQAYIHYGDLPFIPHTSTIHSFYDDALGKLGWKKIHTYPNGLIIYQNDTNELSLYVMNQGNINAGSLPVASIGVQIASRGTFSAHF